jgi:hypothetical protein
MLYSGKLILNLCHKDITGCLYQLLSNYHTLSVAGITFFGAEGSGTNDPAFFSYNISASSFVVPARKRTRQRVPILPMPPIHKAPIEIQKCNTSWYFSSGKMCIYFLNNFSTCCAVIHASCFSGTVSLKQTRSENLFDPQPPVYKLSKLSHCLLLRTI